MKQPMAPSNLFEMGMEHNLRRNEVRTNIHLPKDITNVVIGYVGVAFYKLRFYFITDDDVRNMRFLKSVDM